MQPKYLICIEDEPNIKLYSWITTFMYDTYGSSYWCIITETDSEFAAQPDAWFPYYSLQTYYYGRELLKAGLGKRCQNI